MRLRPVSSVVLVNLFLTLLPAAAQTTAPTSSAGGFDSQIRSLFDRAGDALAKRDYVQLLKLQLERRRVVAETGVLAKEWNADAAAIEQADKLLAETRYSEAVRLLQDRWAARKSAELVNGDLVLALVRAAMSSTVLDDVWLIPGRDLCAQLDIVIQRDPMCVQALVLRAWLIPRDPHDELLRIDARNSVIERNRLLLPLRDALVRDCPDYEVAARRNPGFMSLQDICRKGVKNLPFATFREVMAPLEFCLALSRMAPCVEQAEWISLLRQPTIRMVDRAGTLYVLTNGVLWRQFNGKDGMEWQMLCPPTTAGNRTIAIGEGWIPKRLRLLCWTDSSGRKGAPNSLHTRLANATPTADFNVTALGGNRLQMFPSRYVAPEEIETIRLPLGELNVKMISSAWGTSATRDYRAEQGMKLIFQSQPVPADGYSTLPLAEIPDPRYRSLIRYILDLRSNPVVGVLETQSAIVLPLFDFRTNGRGLRSMDGRELVLRDDNRFEIHTTGGGRALIPLSTARYDAKTSVATLRRLVRAMSSDCPALASLRQMIERIPREGKESLDELLIQAVTQDNPVIRPSKSVSSADWVKTLREYNGLRRALFVQLSRLPYGFDSRDRMVKLSSYAGSRDVDLVFLDNNGDVIPQFYSNRDLAKLDADMWADFLTPSTTLVPWPKFRSLIGDSMGAPVPRGFSQPLLDSPALVRFLIDRAAQAEKEGNYHLAASIYRELSIPLSVVLKLNAAQPIGKQEFENLTQSFTATAETGLLKLRIRRISHADLLKRIKRDVPAVELRRTAMAEWYLGGLPLMAELRRYGQAYGYQTGDRFNQVMDAVAQLIADLPSQPVRPLQSDSAVQFDPTLFDAQLPRAELEQKLNDFYDRQPPLEPYVQAKRWLVENRPDLRYRNPRSDVDISILMWAPNRSDGNRILSLRDELFAGKATPQDPRARSWIEILHAMETGKTPDYLRIRQLLIRLAIVERTEAQNNPFTSLECNVRLLNSVAAMFLAAVTDAQVPAGCQPASFDRSMLEFARLELEQFVQPRLVAGGPDLREVESAIAPVRDIIRNVHSHTDLYLRDRYYWFEYGPLVSEIFQHFKSLDPRK